MPCAMEDITEAAALLLFMAVSLLKPASSLNVGDSVVTFVFFWRLWLIFFSPFLTEQPLLLYQSRD